MAARSRMHLVCTRASQRALNSTRGLGEAIRIFGDRKTKRIHFSRSVFIPAKAPKSRYGRSGTRMGSDPDEERQPSPTTRCRAVVAIRVRPVHRVLVLPHTLASLCSSVRRCEINATVSRNHPRCRRALPSCSGGMTGRTRCWNALPPHVSHECVGSTPLLSQTCANT